MKRKRKEHLAGVSIRKFVGRKKSAIVKSTLKVEGMRAMGRAKVVQAWQRLAERVAEMARDRPDYVARFFETWQAAADSIQGSAEKMLAEHSFVPINPDLGLNPYGIAVLTIFARLMDNLSYEEEEALRDMIVRLNGAWGMYFSVIRLRWPKLSALIDRAEEIREALQLEVQRLFFGEVVPALGARWLVAHDGLEKALELIGKEAKNDLA